MALRAFLQGARAVLAGAGSALPPRVTLVLGNQSADLDSVVSALVHAHALSRAAHGRDDVFLPVVNIPRADFPLRTEVNYMCGRVGIGSELITFVDDPGLQAVRERAADTNLRVVLVDHNQPTTDQAGLLGPRVVQILDHHDDSGAFPALKDKVIERVGSCATLVAQHALDAGVGLPDTDAELLLSAILLDTVNLDASKGRCTPKDREMAARLRDLLPTDCDPEALFTAANNAKFDVSGLTVLELLRKDYKQAEMGGGRVHVGVAAVGLQLSKFAAKGKDLAGELQRFAAERELDLLVVMTLYREPEFSRQLLLHAADPSLLAETEQFLVATELELEALVVDGIALPAYQQRAVKLSRKVVLPLLHDFFLQRA